MSSWKMDKKGQKLHNKLPDPNLQNLSLFNFITCTYMQIILAQNATPPAANKNSPSVH